MYCSFALAGHRGTCLRPLHIFAFAFAFAFCLAIISISSSDLHLYYDVIDLTCIIDVYVVFTRNIPCLFLIE